DPGLSADRIAEAVMAWRAKTPLFDRVYLFDRQGRLLYPGRIAAADAGVFAGLLAEISQGFWERGGRRHFVGDGHVVLAAVLPGTAGGAGPAPPRGDQGGPPP